jgi:hypothetical protein
MKKNKMGGPVASMDEKINAHKFSPPKIKKKALRRCKYSPYDNIKNELQENI